MLVVGAALVRDGQVLAGLRHHPRGWEFPGGKVEPGETPGAAVVRECAEEVGVVVDAIRCVATARDARIELQLWHVGLVTGEPRVLHDHVALRWVGADGLDALDWLDIDRDLLPAVRDLLG